MARLLAGTLVSSHHRGRGIGRKMGEDSLVVARELGYSAMQFNFVVSTNNAAVGLWHSLGFETVGVVPEAFRHPTLGLVDALIMHRSLVESEESAGESPYDIQMEPLFEGLQLMDVDEVSRSSDHPWFNRTLCKVNSCLVRLGVFEGEFHWHEHPAEDELFYVVTGELFIDFEDESFSLGPGQGLLVPRGEQHRPRAPKKTVVLMVEAASVTPTGS